VDLPHTFTTSPTNTPKTCGADLGEYRPRTLPEPDVTASRHPAPIIRPWAVLVRQ
jgi:hypothetical protein